LKNKNESAARSDENSPCGFFMRSPVQRKDTAKAAHGTRSE